MTNFYRKSNEVSRKIQTIKTTVDSYKTIAPEVRAKLNEEIDKVNFFRMFDSSYWVLIFSRLTQSFKTKNLLRNKLKTHIQV